MYRTTIPPTRRGETGPAGPWFHPSVLRNLSDLRTRSPVAIENGKLHCLCADPGRRPRPEIRLTRLPPWRGCAALPGNRLIRSPGGNSIPAPAVHSTGKRVSLTPSIRRQALRPCNALPSQCWASTMICSGRFNGVVGAPNLADPMLNRHNSPAFQMGRGFEEGHVAETRRRRLLERLAGGPGPRRERQGRVVAWRQRAAPAWPPRRAHRRTWPEQINTLRAPAGAFKAVGRPSGVRHDSAPNRCHVDNFELLDRSPPRRSVSA